MADYEMRPVRADEVDAHLDATARAFYDETHPDLRALWTRECEPERTLDVFAGDEIVGTSGLLTRQLTVPGAVVPMAGVTSVGVRPDHRRRGLLGRMMRGHLAAIRDRGEEAVAALWASEATIYGRYGFGLAARGADLKIRSADARLAAPGRDLPRPRMSSVVDARPHLAAVHEAVRPGRPGMLGRRESEWDLWLRDPEHERKDRSPLQAALVDGGYAVFAIRRGGWEDGAPAGVVEVRELLAETVAAQAALWSFLLELSLTRTVEWEAAPSDDPLPHMLADPRAVTIAVADTLWVRLVDVARALAQRTYAAPLDVVLEVADASCPHNEGRVRLAGDASGATCEPTGDAPDLSLSANELGAAYLGGTPLGVLAAAGRVQERTPGALAAADIAFRAAREPWCPEVF
jgi:predicted acetyltransferase